MAGQEQDDDDWSVDSDYAAPEEGREGPPADWPLPSWFNRDTGDWWFQGRKDPCPVKPQGYTDGQYVFVTAAGEYRKFTAGQLHGRGGPADLFGGSLWWPLKHFRKWDAEKKTLTGGLQLQKCMSAMIRMCVRMGKIDDSVVHRSVGVWRGPDGKPIVHAGDRIFVDGKVCGPGELIGDVLYVVGGKRKPPANDEDDRGFFRWEPADVMKCHHVAAHLDEWHWENAESRDLFLGGLWCDMLGDAPLWKPHKFVRAPAGSGKSLLLRYSRALLGGAAHNIVRTYSKARLEAQFAHTACAILLDEAETRGSGSGRDQHDTNRIQQIFDLALLLSDEGATGGRYQRDIDLHGTVTMVATLTDTHRDTIRSRMAFLELRGLRERTNHTAKTPEGMQAMIAEAGELSAAVRARALATFGGLFMDNLRRAREKIQQMGGDQRDADTLGMLIAGWATATAEHALTEDEVGKLERFKPFIRTVRDEEDGLDDASELFNTLMGLPVQSHRSLTVGQLIAKAREPDSGANDRDALRPLGLRLDRQKSEVTGRWESWGEAWLAIANQSPGLDKLFVDYPRYRGQPRSQTLKNLKRTIDGQLFTLKASKSSMKFAGSESRAWLVPPQLLPSLAEERDGDGPAPGQST